MVVWVRFDAVKNHGVHPMSRGPTNEGLDLKRGPTWYSISFILKNLAFLLSKMHTSNQEPRFITVT